MRLKDGIIGILLLAVSFLQAQNNIKKGTGIIYTNGAPTVSVNTDYYSEVAIDSSTGYWWEYQRDSSGGIWQQAGFRVQETGTTGTPTYWPSDKQSHIVVNTDCELFYWSGGSWCQISGGGGGSDTQDLSITGGGGTIRLVSGGFVVLNDSSAINELQTIDTFFIENDSLKLSLLNDSESYHAVDLSGYLDDTDNQYIDTLDLSAGNDSIRISLYNDGIAKKTLYLPYLLSEVDGSTTNEIQTIDTFTRSNDTLFLSLSSDGQAAKTYVIQDNSKANEGSLVPGGNGTNEFTLSTNTIGSPSLTIQGRGIVNVKDSASTYMLITGTEVDGSTTNEGLLSWNVSANLATLTSNTSGSETLLAAGRNGITLTDSSGYLIFTGSAAGSTDTTYFHHQNGNSYGATWKGGTNDNFGIDLEIQDTAALQINTSQVATFTLSTSTTNALVDQVYIDTKTYNTAAAGFGGSLMFKGESTTTESQGMATIGAYWTNATHINREAALTFQLGDNGGALAEVMKIDRTVSSGKLSFGTTNPLLVYASGVYGQGVSTTFSAQSGQLTLASSGNIILLDASDNAGYVKIGQTGYTSTSLAHKDIRFNNSYSAASGTGVLTALSIENTYNLTSTASGAQIGIDINPTLTSLTAATYRGINIPYSNASAYGIYSSGIATQSYWRGIIKVDTAIWLKQINEPGNPSTDYGIVFKGTDDSLYFKNEAGTLMNICRQGSGGGSYTDENAQDAIGAMINASLQYVDGTPLLAINDRDFGDITTSGSGLTMTIDNSTITSAKILDGTIATGDLADSLITTVKIVSNAVGTTALASSSVTSLKIADGTIATADLADSLITEVKLITNSVGSNAIKASAVGTSEINDNSIEGSDLANMLTTTGNTTFGNSVNDLTLSSINGANEGVLYVTSGYVNQYTTNGSITSRINNNPDSIYITSKKLDINADSFRLKLTGAYGTSGQFVKVGANGLLEFGSGGAGAQNLSYDAANHEVDISGGGTSATVPLADDDGATEGLASFTANDFDADANGNISIDYTNGQAASGSNKGFLTSTDWTTFNNKSDSYTNVASGNIPTNTYAQVLRSRNFGLGYSNGFNTLNAQKDRGIFFMGNALKLINGDSTTLTDMYTYYNAATIDQKVDAVNNVTGLYQDSTNIQLSVQDINNLAVYKYTADSVYYDGKKLRFAFDSLFLSVGGYPSAGKVLTGNANGSATWQTAGAADGNGIYSGSGNIPTSTYAQLLKSETMTIGYVPNHPTLADNGVERGILFDGSNALHIVCGDSATAIFARTTYNNGITHIAGTAGSSDYGLVEIASTGATLKAEDVGDGQTSYWYVKPDSIYGISQKLYGAYDSIRLKIQGSFGTSGQVLKVGSNGLATWGTDNTTGLSDADYGDITVSSSGSVWTIDASTITTSKILDSTIAEVDLATNSVGSNAIKASAVGTSEISDGSIINSDVNDDYILLNGGNTTAATMNIGSNDNFAVNLEVQDTAQLTLNTDGTNMFTIYNSATTSLIDHLYLDAESYNTPGAGFGSSIMFKAKSSTTAAQNLATIGAYWTNATHINREGAITFQLGDNAGALAEVMKLDRTTSTGLLSIGTTTPLLLTNSTITGQTGGGLTITGGAAVGDSIIYKPTTANGTDAQGAHVFKVDNNGGTTAMTIRNNGNIGIGTPVPFGQLDISDAAASTTRGLYITQHNDGINAPIFTTQKSRGTKASPTAVASGDFIGLFDWKGYVGSTNTYTKGARITALVNGTVTDANDALPTDLSFWVSNGTTCADRLRIEKHGQLATNSGIFAATSDAESRMLNMRKAITGTAASELFIDGSSLQNILPSTNAVWNVSIDIVAVCTAAGNGTCAAGDSWVAKRYAGIKRLNTTTSLVGSVETLGTDKADTNMSTAVTTITADDTNEALKITWTPPSTAGSTSTFRVVATIRLTQVQY